jgi:hypothetical protein
MQKHPKRRYAQVDFAILRLVSQMNDTIPRRLCIGLRGLALAALLAAQAVDLLHLQAVTKELNGCCRYHSSGFRTKTLGATHSHAIFAETFDLRERTEARVRR